MKSPWIINVGDLMVEGGKSDTVTMGPLKHTELPNLTGEGVELRIHLASMNEKQLLATIQKLHAQVEEICDYTAKEYTRDIDLEGEFMQFAFKPEEDQMLISSMMTIDIAEWVYQLIKMTEPFQKVYPGYVVPETDDEFDPETDLTVQGGVIFK